jgi:hypothetical protein
MSHNVWTKILVTTTVYSLSTCCKMYAILLWNNAVQSVFSRGTLHLKYPFLLAITISLVTVLIAYTVEYLFPGTFSSFL